MLEARGLTKRYGGLLALDRVSFQLQRGEIVGYLGPNGSGKSTTVNIRLFRHVADLLLVRDRVL
jgi:ABC-type multidrug transport system ATPase subunit